MSEQRASSVSLDLSESNKFVEESEPVILKSDFHTHVRETMSYFHREGVKHGFLCSGPDSERG